MPGLVPFFIILLAGLVFSKLFNRLHLPWVVALILGGIIIGPHGMGLFKPDPTIEFLAQIGLVFLMFMAGLEIRFSSFRQIGRAGLVLPLLNGLIPFAVGIGLGLLLDFPFTTVFLLGVVFLNSSVSVIVPSLESSGLLHQKIGQVVVTSTVILDILSLFLLSIPLQTATELSRLPLAALYVILPVALFVLRWLVPRARAFFATRGAGSDIFEQNVFSVVAILVGTVVIFELLGLHPIVAGFFAGLVLSESITSEILKEKLHVLAYGFFIPIFFVTIGGATNIGLLTETSGALGIVILVIVFSTLAKFASGWLAGRLSGFSSRLSSFVGLATTPQLSAALAVVFAGQELNLIPQEIVTAMIFLAVLTTLFVPILIDRFATRRWLRQDPIG